MSKHHRIVQLLPLSSTQQRAMVEARVPDAQQAKAFLTGVQEPRLAELAQNPLMMTMLLSVFQQRGGTLPERRSELYRAALHSMLERADTASKGGHGALELEPCLRQVAHASHTRPRGEQFRVFQARAQAAVGRACRRHAIQAGRWNKSWKRRYCTLQGRELTYYAGQDAAGNLQEKGRVHISGVIDLPSGEVGGDPVHRLNVTASGSNRVLQLKASSAAEKQYWLSALRAAGAAAAACRPARTRQCRPR